MKQSYATVTDLFCGAGGSSPKSGGRLLDGRTWDEFPVERFARERWAREVAAR